MSDAPSSPDSGPPSPAAPATRTIRTYKNRSLAEAAVERLTKEGIEASILELAPPPGRPALKSDAVRVVVNAEDAARAMKLLVVHSPEGTSGAGSEPRRRPRPAPHAKTGMPWLFILISLFGAGGAIFYFVSNFYGPKTPQGPIDKPVERFVNEDLNHDGKIDVRRYLNAAGHLAREEQDWDFDGKWDSRSNFENGKLKRRTLDIDKNGVYDEETMYDRLGRPYYSQLRMNGQGAVTKRMFYQEAVEFDDWDPSPEELGPPDDPREKNPVRIEGGDSWPYKILLDNDVDGHFDVEQLLNIKGEVKSERKLEKGAPENDPPPF